MAKRRTRKSRQASRLRSERPERGQDPRLIATQVRAVGGEPVTEETWIVAISPIELDDGRQMAWSTPQAVVFNLIEADRFLKRGLPQRRKIMSRLVKHGDFLRPKHPTATLDCVRDLQMAIFCAFTAIEALANHGIDMLDDDFVLDLGDKQIPKVELVRRLGTEDKFRHTLPYLEQCRRIAGTRAWERLRELKSLRDDLVHVKDRGPGADPKIRTAYDRLLLGDADNCVAHTREIIEAAWPGFIPDHVKAILDD